MKKFMHNVIESVVFSVQMLVLLMVCLVFIFAPNLAVSLGLGYMKFRAVLGA